MKTQIFSLLIGCFLLFTNRSDGAVTLCATGAVWKYFDQNTYPGSSWTQTSFNDSGWSSGAAPLGFGDPVTTVINGGPSGARFITTYFRHSFNVANVAALTNFSLRIRRDDGLAVYLNGSEILRDNLPAAPLVHSSLATEPISGWDELEHRTFMLVGCPLREGANILAVELHQSTLISSDLSFDLEFAANLTGLTTPNVIADSAGSFSAVQGREGWFFGYLTAPTDQASFTQLDTTSIFPESGRLRWRHWNYGPPLTEVTTHTLHPAALVSSGIPTEFAAKRFVSPSSQTVTVQSVIRDNNPDATGDGVQTTIVKGGAVLLSRTVSPGNSTGYWDEFAVTLTAGQPLDMVVAPVGTDNGDSTWFVMRLLGSPAYVQHPLAGLSNFRAKFRTNSSIVDIFYDLTAAAAYGNFTVSLTYSTNGGITFESPVAGSTGHIGLGIAPGAGKQVVWDTTQQPDLLNTPSLIVQFKASASVLPATVVATTAVNTWWHSVTGPASLGGRVVNLGGVPVVGAQVRLLNTPQTTNTVSGGTFNLVGLPSGRGYILSVSAPGYAVQRFPSIDILASANNLGTLVLGTAINLPTQVRPLVPDVNPQVTTVEQDGTAFRYYQVVTTDGRKLPGGITVGLRRAGGAVVPQGTSSSSGWAGLVTGQSDMDEYGLVRLELPSSFITAGGGNTASFEVLLNGTVVQTFTATVKPREYEQVWKQKLEGSASWTSRGPSVGLKGAISSELRHELRGGVVQQETIGWQWEAEIKAGPGLEIKMPDNGVVKLKASAGAGFYVGYDYSAEYSFPSESSDEDVNVEKIYAAYVPFLKASSVAVRLLSGETPYEKLVNHYATQVTSRRTRTEWNGHVGGYAEGLLEVGVKVPQNPFLDAEVEVERKLEGEIGGFAGIENVFGRGGEEAGQGVVFGFEVATERGVKRLMQNIKLNGADLPSLNQKYGFEASVKGRVWTPQTSFNPTRVDLEIARETERGTDLNLIAWNGLNFGLSPGEKVETTETLSFVLPYPEYYNQFAAQGEVWGLMRNYTATKLKAQPGVVAEFFSGLLGDPYQRNQVVGYERKAYRALTLEVPTSYEVENLTEAFGVELGAKFERGAEGTMEKGVLWQLKRLPLESYPAVTSDDFPPVGYWRKQEEWMRRGFPTFNAVVERVEHFINNVAGGINVVRDGVQAAYLQVNNGLQAGGQWISSTVTGLLPGNNFAPARNHLKSGNSLFEPLPNQVYGVGGAVRFDSTNDFTGTATLMLNYNDADIAGLIEADLRIYGLVDGSNRWQLIGGVVNALSNNVTATITNLGTFAIAPPLPAGDLVLSVASNSLTADGVATSVITVSNLMLNNGQVATQSWLYTVAASGVEIVETDVTTNYSGVQLVSTNGVLRFTVRAPLGGYSAKVAVASVAGDAAGELGINLVDNAPPLAPAGVTVSAGQSRLLVGWQTNAETDLAGYRVYYRAGNAGPPWDGTAAVEGSSSPVAVAGTNVTLRGLASGTNYFVALAGVDTTGNESAPTVVGPLTLVSTPPQPPTGVAVSFGADGTNFLSWALSEDDGYNDRDVARYDIYQAILPGEAFVKIGEAPAGVGVYGETNVPVAVGSFLRYAVRAVDTNGQASAQALANRFLSGGNGVDNDGDGMADDWELAHGLNPQDPTDGAGDADQDGVSNLAEYLAGSDPSNAQSNLKLLSAGLGTNGFQIIWSSAANKLYTIQRATELLPGGGGFSNLVEHILATPPQNTFLDTAATNGGQFFYRLKVE